MQRTESHKDSATAARALFTEKALQESQEGSKGTSYQTMEDFVKKVKDSTESSGMHEKKKRDS